MDNTLASTEMLTSLTESAHEKYFFKAEAASKEGFDRLEQCLDSLRAGFAELKEETKVLREANIKSMACIAFVEQKSTALSVTMTRDKVS